MSDIVDRLKVLADANDSGCCEEARCEIVSVRSLLSQANSEVEYQKQEIDLLRGRLKALVEQCAYVRDSAEHIKHRRQHAVSETTWAAFCSQIRAARGKKI